MDSNNPNNEPVKDGIAENALPEITEDTSRVECERCNGLNVRAMYLCKPCNGARDGATDWTSEPALLPDGKPARQPCPNCEATPGPKSYYCTDCGHAWDAEQGLK